MFRGCSRTLKTSNSPPLVGRRHTTFKCVQKMNLFTLFMDGWARVGHIRAWGTFVFFCDLWEYEWLLDARPQC